MRISIAALPSPSRTASRRSRAYADWFFEWKRSYVVLKESLTSAVTRFFEVGKYKSLTEAVEADVKDYFLKNYKEQVLKPELRDRDHHPRRRAGGPPRP